MYKHIKSTYSISSCAAASIFLSEESVFGSLSPSLSEEAVKELTVSLAALMMFSSEVTEMMTPLLVVLF